MRLVIQQVKSAKLDIEESNIHREIWRWIIIYLWIHVDDLDTYQEKIARIMKKFALLKRLTWPDWNINTSLQDIVINITTFKELLKKMDTKLKIIKS